MDAAETTALLTEGTILEGPHWTQPVRVLTAKRRGSRIEVQADATEPTVLWLLKCGVEEGRGHMIGERLFAIHGRKKGSSAEFVGKSHREKRTEDSFAVNGGPVPQTPWDFTHGC